MKTRRKIERQTRSKTSESETDREYPRKSKNPNMGNNKNTRQSTIPGYVTEVRQNLMKQQERDKMQTIKETQNKRKETETQNKREKKKKKRKEKQKTKNQAKITHLIKKQKAERKKTTSYMMMRKKKRKTPV